MERPKAIIVDLDGSLCDSSWRTEAFLRGEKKNWDAFYAGIPADPVRHHVLATVIEHWVAGTKVIFLTGRSSDHRPATNDWMKRVLPWKLEGPLLMREPFDRREDVVVKREHYEKTIGPSYEVVLAIDDRPSVIRMWKELGIETLDVGDGIEF